MGTRAGRVHYRPFRAADLKAVRDIISKSFSEEVETHPRALAEYPNEAYYQPDNLLVAEVDGRVTSQMGLRDGYLWLSGHPFPAALVGTVCTHPDYRGQGIGAGMLRYSFEVLQGSGVVLTYLHTIPPRYNFYRRLGYTPTPHEQVTAVAEVTDLQGSILRGQASLGPGLRRRRALPADAAILDSLYRETASRGTGAWSRNDLFWKRRLQGRAKLWLSGCPDFELAVGGEPLAYVATVREGPRWQIVELAHREGAEGVARNLMAGVLASARTVGTEQVQITLPSWMGSEEMFASFATGIQRKRELVFLRLHDVGRFLELAAPILTRRADAADLALTLTVGGTPGHHLEVGSGDTDLALSVGPSHLAALLYNGEAMGELLKAKAVKVRPESEASLQRLCDLFPPTRAGRFPMDGY